jgi:hypothetical protein
LITARLEDDQAKLIEISTIDERHHKELVERGNRLVSKVEQLTDAIHAQAEELRLQRVQEQEHQAVEAEKNHLLNVLLTKFIEMQVKWYCFFRFTWLQTDHPFQSPLITLH